MRVCDSCGQENPQGARFCNSCAAPLGADDAAGVRKTVTVVFCDLVGSTALGDRSDPELLREVMKRYHAELRTVLERHGGTVEKFVGDAAMAVFGIPKTHEDDALRAVRAAFEMREAVKHLGLEVRIGVNTGEVVAGQGETLVTGDAVNVAARLEQAAGTGEILVGETVQALVGAAVKSEPVKPLTLKGKPEPVPAFRLVELLPDMPAFREPGHTPFVGREEELLALRAALSGAIEGKRPQLITIVGPPGIGKSRLAGELVAGSPARVLTGRCMSYGEGITYRPLAEVASQVGDLTEALGDEPDAGLAVSRIQAALGSEGSEASSEEIAWGFRKLFEAISRHQPLVVVLDDIHWAEPTLLDLIEYVATFSSGVPLVLLCMARPDLFELRPGWATPRPDSTLVTLEPLATSDVEVIVDHLHEVPAQVKARIIDAAEGNPLFAEQMVAMQAEGGSEEGELPPTIQALLAARIDRIGPEERAVMERASVEGRTFHRGSVTALLPQGADEGVGGHLMTLVRKEFVHPDRSTIPGDDGFRFGHNLIRDAAYESIPKRIRSELHERLGEWLEARLGDDAPVEIVGYHLESAHRYRVELGMDDDHASELGRRAARLLKAAGRRAQARGDDRATRALLERALALLPENDPALPSLLALLGPSIGESGDVVDALDVLRRAREAAASLGQRDIELRARMDELTMLVRTDPVDLDDCLEEARSAIAELEHLQADESSCRAWRAVIEIGFVRSNFELVGEASSGLLEAARRAGIRREEVWAVRGLAAALAYGPTPTEEAIRQAEEALADFPQERAGEDHLALLYAFAGRHQDAQEAMERSKRVRQELGQKLDLAGLALDAGWMAILAGDPGRAEDDLRAATEAFEAVGEVGYAASIAAVLGETLYLLGRFDEAEELARKGERLAPPQDVEAQTQWRMVRAKLLASGGKGEEALQLSSEAVELSRRAGLVTLIGDCLFVRAEVLSSFGHTQEAREYFQEALEVFERKGIVPSIEKVKAQLAVLSA